MPDPQPRPTDLGAVLETTTRIIRNVETLTRRWVAEDQGAYAPRSTNGDSPGSSGTSDPTAAIADQPRKHRDRDHIGTQLHHVDTQLAALIRATAPRTPTAACRCCHEELATHGADEHGNPIRCHRCDRYLRDNRTSCDDAVHRHRPDEPRMCGCPDVCCPQDRDGHTSCTDRAAEGRRLSDRCRQRLHRRTSQATG